MPDASPRQVDVRDIEALRAMVSENFGDWSEALVITQDMVNRFAELTGDRQWIHVDVERAKTESPFGGPIAHGYYTLSMVPFLMEQIWTMTGASSALNYGLNKLRFPAPVLIGSRVRLHVTLNGVDEIPGGIQVNVTLTIEIEGAGKPALAAEGLYRFYAA